MAKSLSAQRFLESPEAIRVRTSLEALANDPNYNTKSMYSPAAGGQVPFVDKHMDYLSQHLSVNVEQYLSNLRLMTKIRS
jgi:hypothetical protein